MKPRVAWVVAAVCAAALLLASIAWIRANPLPSYYDEALYAIYALIDVWALKTYGLTGAYYAMLTVDPASPPALRILALPFTAIASPSLALLRAVSLAGLFASAAIIAIAVRRIAGDIAAALAFLFTIALPSIVTSTQMFHTEYVLLLAITLLLLATTSNRPGLLAAMSVALGMLAKASYGVMAAPIILIDRRRSTIAGSAIGALFALPWWLRNAGPAFGLLRLAGGFVRHALHGRSYIYELIRCNFGFGVAAAVIVCLTRWRKLSKFAIACMAGAIPLIVMHAAAVGHNPRHIAVAAVLIAAGATTLVPQLTRAEQLIVFALAVLQIGAIVIPMPRRDDGSYIWRGATEVMAPTPQWDWSRLRQFAALHGYARPRIATLGEGYAFNPPQIRYGWPELRGEVPVEQLYEWTERKPFDLPASVERASFANLVVTVPGYPGEATDGQVPNNAYNAQFAQALAGDPRFDGPYAIDVGLRRPAVVQVFVRR